MTDASKSQTGADVNPENGSNGTVATSRPYEKLVEGIKSRATLDAVDSFDMASQALDKIADASSWEDIVAANEKATASAEEFFGQPLNVTDVAFPASDPKYKKGVGAFVVITAFTDDGEVHTITSGGPNVVGSLYKAQLLGLIKQEKPLRMKILGRETANGTLQTVASA